MAKGKPYSYQSKRIIKECGGKEKAIIELQKAIKDLAEYPEANINQLIFFCNILKFIKNE